MGLDGGQIAQGVSTLNVEELEDSLEEIRQSIPASMLRNMFDRFDARMQRVVDLAGDYMNM